MTLFYFPILLLLSLKTANNIIFTLGKEPRKFWRAQQQAPEQPGNDKRRKLLLQHRAVRQLVPEQSAVPGRLQPGVHPPAAPADDEGQGVQGRIVPR